MLPKMRPPPPQNFLKLALSIVVRLEAERTVVAKAMNETVIKNIRSATTGHFVLGNDRLKREIERALEQGIRQTKSGRNAITSDYRGLFKAASSSRVNHATYSRTWESKDSQCSEAKGDLPCITAITYIL